MKPSECGFATPPAEDTPAREQMDRFADFLRLMGEGRGAIQDRLYRDPAMRAFVFGDADKHGPGY